MGSFGGLNEPLFLIEHFNCNIFIKSSRDSQVIVCAFRVYYRNLIKITHKNRNFPNHNLLSSGSGPACYMFVFNITFYYSANWPLLGKLANTYWEIRVYVVRAWALPYFSVYKAMVNSSYDKALEQSVSTL